MGEMAEYFMDMAYQEDWQADLDMPEFPRVDIEKIQMMSPTELVDSIELALKNNDIKPDSLPVKIAEYFRRKGYISLRQRIVLINTLIDIGE